MTFCIFFSTRTTPDLEIFELPLIDARSYLTVNLLDKLVKNLAALLKFSFELELMYKLDTTLFEIPEIISLSDIRANNEFFIAFFVFEKNAIIK